MTQRFLVFFLFVVLLGMFFLMVGCAALPADPAKMTPEQLKEFVKDKNATISCGLANNPYGRIVAMYVNLDKAVLNSGAVSVSNECNVTIQADPKPPAPPK